MKKITLIGAVALALSQPAFAAVIEHADVNGLRTFQDVDTGRVWLDLDNFHDAGATTTLTGYQMITAAQNAGFTFATHDDVQGLLDGLPLDNNQWAGYAQTMGYGIPRQLIWGMYDDNDGNPYGWAWSYSGDTNWNYTNNAADANVFQNIDYPGQIDMGIFAYQTGEVSQVPEPASLGLLGLGVAGLLAARRRRSA